MSDVGNVYKVARVIQNWRKGDIYNEGDMKKIGIITIYGNNNIGNKLQNYAVQEILKKKGFFPETIPEEVERKEGVFSERKLKLFLLDIFFKLNIKKGRAEKHYYNKKREKRFQQFSSKYLTVGKTVNIYNIPKNLHDFYDYFVVGSDQVWHNWSGTEEELRYFFLMFAEKKKRLCISPSFGKEKIEKKYRKLYQEGLQGFKMLSCREESGVALIRDLVQRDAVLMLDPTMMLSDEEWMVLARQPQYKIQNRYMLVYFLGNCSEENRVKMKTIAESNQLQIIDILDIEQREFYMTDPAEFLYLVKNAQLICTDSFHGCVFSLLFHKNFLCFKREGLDAENMENRLLTLLKKFRFEHRLAECVSKEDIFSSSFENMENILAKEREVFNRYLYELFEESDQ